MQQREQRLSQRAFSSNSPTMNSAYASAMKSMQEKLKNDTYRKSIDLSPQDIIIEQLKQQVNELSSENDRLQMQLMKVSQEMEMNNRATQQIELLQVERLQHLKDYQDRVSELIRKNEELKHDKHEIQMSFESLQRQLQAYKNNEKGLLHKVEMKKFEENSILLNNVQEYKQKIDIKDNIIKKLEKRIEFIELEKQKAEQDFENYKQKNSSFKLHEFEKQISNLKYQLDEKDRAYLKNIDEAQSNRFCREEQMAKRIQELILKSSEYQDIIQQLTIDYKDLSVKYQTIKIKLEQEEKSHKYLKRRISRQEETEFNQGYREQRTISKLNLDQISPTLPSPRADQSLRQSQLKQAIKDCLVDTDQKLVIFLKLIILNFYQKEISFQFYFIFFFVYFQQKYFSQFFEFCIFQNNVKLIFYIFFQIQMNFLNHPQQKLFIQFEVLINQSELREINLIFKRICKIFTV